MKHFQKIVVLTLLCVFSFLQTEAQFGIGFTFSDDLYNRYTNPDNGEDAHRSNGSALLNLALGPKIWLGAEKFSFSVEGQANLGILGVSVPDSKGLGNVAFPIIGQFNFKGLSGLNKEGSLGFSLGGGIQYNKTELYGLDDTYAEQGVTRSFFKTYVAQVGYGFGISGFAAKLYVRYGWNPNLDGANSFNVGLQWDFNVLKLNKLSDPASEL